MHWIVLLQRKLLTGNGKISHKQAIEKEFELYRTREMKQLESDFDKAVKELERKEVKIQEKSRSEVSDSE